MLRRLDDDILGVRCVSRRRRRTTAFTLLEVMVVVAVIALLIAILLPAFTAARRTARQVKCQANLSQIGKGWQSYLNTSRGAFPQSISGSDNMQLNFGGQQGSGPPFVGQKVLNSHLGLPLIARGGSAEVFDCPADDGSPVDRPTCFARFGTSYQMNEFLVALAGLSDMTGTAFEPIISRIKSEHITRIRVKYRWITKVCVNASELVGPARTLYCGDLGFSRQLDPQLTGETNADWHRPLDSYNLLFGDGHVDFTRIQKGKYLTDRYVAIAFKNLQNDLRIAQESP